MGGTREAETETRDRHFHGRSRHRQPQEEEEEQVKRKRATLRPEQVVRKWCERGDGNGAPKLCERSSDSMSRNLETLSSALAQIFVSTSPILLLTIYPRNIKPEFFPELIVE